MNEMTKCADVALWRTMHESGTRVDTFARLAVELLRPLLESDAGKYTNKGALIDLIETFLPLTCDSAIPLNQYDVVGIENLGSFVTAYENGFFVSGFLLPLTVEALAIFNTINE